MKVRKGAIGRAWVRMGYQEVASSHGGQLSLVSLEYKSNRKGELERWEKTGYRGQCIHLRK